MNDEQKLFDVTIYLKTGQVVNVVWEGWSITSGSDGKSVSALTWVNADDQSTLATLHKIDVSQIVAIVAVKRK
jgi:hypothetical protein